VLVLPLVAAGSVAAWLGMWYEILRLGHGKLLILLGESNRKESP
jgi:hypothetical protein